MGVLGSVIASVPETNRMKLGNIDSVLPVNKMQEYYLKMEPVMIKYFGPSFSNYTLIIEADPTKDAHGTGFIPERHALLLAGQAQDYVKNKDSDPKHAMENIYGSMKHELSHGMYMYNKEMISFGIQWPWEGWAKFLEEKISEDLENKSVSIKFFYQYYLPRDITAGTQNWGSFKQNTNHGLVYGMTTATHFILISAASSSKDSYDFLKKMNNAIYDKIESTGSPQMTLEDYKKLMKPLLSNIKVDGEDAYTWYFNSPASYSNGSLGNHIGISMDSSEQDFKPIGIEVYIFNRVDDSKNKQEKALENINIIVKVIDSLGNSVLEKTVNTDKDGYAKISELESFKEGAYLISAESNIGNNNISTKMFAIIPPRINVEKDYIYGVLLNENNNIINGKYVSLLSSDSDFIYKKNGLFIIKASSSSRIVNINFLGLNQEITKGSFARVYAFKIPQLYIEQAKLKSDEELNAGIIDNTEDLISKEKVDNKPSSVCEGEDCEDNCKDSECQPDEPIDIISQCGDKACDDVEKGGKYYCEQDCKNTPEKTNFFTKIGIFFSNLFRKK